MSEIEPTHLAANELWIPGKDYSIGEEYPTPTGDELVDLWQDYLGPNAKVIPTPGVYGAMRVPDRLPTALVSVDACEVLRDTNLSITRVERSSEDLNKKPIKSIHVYGEGCSYEENQADVHTLAQVLINANLVEPVADIDQINGLMQRWQGLGAYTVLNTSTLPGSEPGTIDFFARYLPGLFDAILLPRNHNSDKSQATKGDVAARLILAAEQVVLGDIAPDAQPPRTLTAIHIDDKSCHNVAFRKAMTNIGANVHTIQPIYPSHLPFDKDSIQAATPLDSFIVADILLGPETTPATDS